MTKALTKILAGLTLATLAACGAGGGDRPDGNGDGKPLATIEGRIEGTAPATPYVNPKVGLVWVKWDENDGYEPTFIEQVTAIDATTLPVSFSLSVFAPPPAAAMNEYVENGTVLEKLAWGLVVAFEDRDADGAFEMDENGIVAPDLLFGAAYFDVMIYIDTMQPEVAAMTFANPALATPGFHVARLDPCTGLLSIVDPANTFVISTFEPSNVFGGEPTLDCGFDGPCAIDESSEACQTCMADQIGPCAEVTCVGELDAINTCGLANGCTGEDPAAVEACVRAHCDAEVTAYDTCMYDCVDPQACYGGPVEG